MPIDLSIIIPAHNEATTIAKTVRDWGAEASRLGISVEILAYDDGSTDGTLTLLTDLAREMPCLQVIHHTNRGHGPTVLAGYAAAQGRWVLQVDGDDEVGTDPFELFWQSREECDLLIGRRRGRNLALPRRMLTAASRTAIALLFGRGLSDVNCPYRLMRASVLRQLLEDVPSDTFAPNVALSGLALVRGCRVLERGVRSRPRPNRAVVRWGVVAAGRLSFMQLLAIARGARRRGPVQRTTR